MKKPPNRRSFYGGREMKPIALYSTILVLLWRSKLIFTRLDKELFLITGPHRQREKPLFFDGLCYALYGEGSNTFPPVKRDEKPVWRPAGDDVGGFYL